MKKYFFLLLFSAILSLSPHAVFAQKLIENKYKDQDIPPMNVIKFKPMNLIIHLFTLQVERMVNQKVSVACDLSYFNYTIPRTTSTNSTSGSSSSYDWIQTQFQGFGISPELRFYPASKGSPKGFYVAGFFEYYTINMHLSGTNPSTGRFLTGDLKGINFTGVGALLGWQWLIVNTFCIETNLGVRYLSITTPDSYTFSGSSQPQKIPTFNAEGLIPVVNFAIGYAF
jgi:hypothetical protein